MENYYIDLHNDVKDIKNEISELKKSIKTEISELKKSIANLVEMIQPIVPRKCNYV